MDGLDARGEVIVIGATNRVDTIDPALRRGGRFDREIQIGVPDVAGRKEILQVHTRGMPLADDVSIDAIARRTHGFVGADLDAVASEAAMAAIRDRPTNADDRMAWNRDPAVTKAHFDAALAAVEPSAMREYVAESPTTDFSDVGGLEEAKQVLRESVEWPLTYERLFEETNTNPPSGVLLYGPPGTGKRCSHEHWRVKRTLTSFASTDRRSSTATSARARKRSARCSNALANPRHRSSFFSTRSTRLLPLAAKVATRSPNASSHSS